MSDDRVVSGEFGVGGKYEVTFDPGFSNDIIYKDLQAIERSIQQAKERGVTELRRRQWSTKHFGRFYLSKEVGPPPWKLPRLYVQRMNRGAIFGAGWRHTLYTFAWKAMRQPKP